MTSENTKTENQLKRLIAKKESLFQRVQNLHDMIPDLAQEKVKNIFIIGVRGLESSNFESLIDEIIDLELVLNPMHSPNYEPLISYETLNASIQIAMDKLRIIKDSSTSEINASTSKLPVSFDHNKYYNHLPPLTIKPYTGIVTDWPRYRDLFSSIIIKNSRLSGVEKLHYLFTTLSDKPAEIIKDFSLSDANFELAWSALMDRYESDRVLATNFFEELIKPDAVPFKPTQDSLQKFITKINVNVSGLKKMNLDDLSDFLLFSIAIRQLDPPTRKEFESKHSNHKIPTYDSLMTFVKSECRLLEITSTAIGHSNSNYGKNDARKNDFTRSPYKSNVNRKVVMSTHAESPAVKSSITGTNISPPPVNLPSKAYQYSIKCPKCSEPHQLYNCSKFLALSVPNRRIFVKEHSRCFNCLGTHTVAACRSVRNCPECLQRHHRSLHLSTPRNPSASNPTALNSAAISSAIHESTSHVSDSRPSATTSSPLPPTLATSSSIKLNRNSVVLLGTACASIKNNQGRYVPCRLLIDCASSASFITKNFVNKLGIPTQPYSQQFTGLSETPVGSSSGIVNCVIKPVHSHCPLISTKALVVNNILHNLPQVDLPATVTRYVKGLTLADPNFYTSRPIDILVGCDVIPKILSANSVTPSHPDIGIISTIFGHVIIGSLTFDLPPNSPCTVNSLLTHSADFSALTDDDLHKSVARFWELETVTGPPISDPEDEFCEKHFLETHRRAPDGRYIVQMPFICDPSSLNFPQSKDIATERFYSLESRFRKVPSLKKDCVNFLHEYETLGHMVKASRPGKYYVPYFCVHNNNSPTTPTRVVFDGSAKRSHISINQVLLSGPKLQHDVPDVILNFRIKPFVFCCDISKMYRQISLDEEQCTFVHIIFRKDPSEPLQDYELRTVTYGLAPSSFLSHRVLIQLTRDEGKNYPLACSAILDNSCVDDIFGGADSLEELFELKNQLTNLLTSGGFPLNKWLSNSYQFLSELKNSDSAGSLVIKDFNDDSIKVLGMGWDPKLDAFFFALDTPPLKSCYTKRLVLSAIARIYDPLGFTAPMIFLFKCILKDVWLTGVGWDDPITPSITELWTQCLTELPNLSTLRIPRCIFPTKPLSCHVLGFCDGSMKGSAAVIYLRVKFPDKNIRIFLLKAKTRVAPSKVQTIPRLELIGAVLLSKLLFSIKPFLSKLPLPNYNTYLFTDSTIVLSWIRKPTHLLKLFVCNRVTAILENSEISNWFHIPTEHNVSDAASRGLTPKALLSHTSWFEGPPWAYYPPQQWPLSNFDVLTDNNMPELKTTVLISKSTDHDFTPPTWLHQYSKFSKLQRVIGYVLRFLHNCRSPNSHYYGPLSSLELKLSLYACIKCDQQSYFQKEIISLSANRPCSPKIQSLSPFLDDVNLIRVGGRLKNSELSYDSKHPILLSNISPLTRLIITYFHEVYLHSGPRTLQALILRKFWIINNRRVIRKVIYSCVRCARFRSSTVSPPMGDLPGPRVTPNRPFLHCGVDLAGPFMLKESSRRNARTYKAYFALFICFSVKAVHIEVLTSLSSDCFIASLQRFASRRGLPSNIYTDQATNFRGAARQLKEIVTFLRDSNSTDIVKEYLNSQGITFNLQVPRAPHMSGLAESNIKNIKFHLKRCIGSQVLTLEEFSTILARVEAILNSRPLCVTSSLPDDLQSLTPGHFLIGAPLVSVPVDDLEDVPVGRLSRWQLVCQISRSLWRRWEQEYLHTLQNKCKWFGPASNLEENQIVWIKEDGSAPLSYPLGRVIQVHPGKDGVVRAATVRTSSGTYRRPVRKLAPLPLS